MAGRIARRRWARQSIVEIALALSADDPRIGTAFLDAVEATLQEICEHPRMARERDFAHPGLTGVRSFPIQGFSEHLVFYRVVDDGIEVLDLLHGARDLESLFRERHLP